MIARSRTVSACLQGSLLAWSLGWFAACLLPATAQAAEVRSYEVLNTYPHDSGAFTQGLVYHEAELYEGTGLYGQSSLRRVELETGNVQQQQPLASQYFGEGITISDDRIIQLTWRENTGFVYDRQTFTQLDTFSYPWEGWGITQDGSQLIMSDGTPTLRFLDPQTFTVTGTVWVQDGTSPVSRLNELEYIDGLVYANVWPTDLIARIDPATGQVVDWLDMTGLLPPADQVGAGVLNGIAYDADNDRLFVTGKLWPTLFEVRMLPELPALSVRGSAILAATILLTTAWALGRRPPKFQAT